MQIKIFLLAAIGALLLAQQSVTNKIKVEVGPGGDPLRPSTCKQSQVGYLEINGRTKLTASEMGQYVFDRIGRGFILTIYPETKDGIAASAVCRNTPSASGSR